MENKKRLNDEKEIKQKLEFYEQKAKEKLQKRLQGDQQDSKQDDQKQSKKDIIKNKELLKKRDIKLYRKEMRRIKKINDQKIRQEKILRGEIVEQVKLDPLVKKQRQQNRIEVLKNLKKQKIETPEILNHDKNQVLKTEISEKVNFLNNEVKKYLGEVKGDIDSEILKSSIIELQSKINYIDQLISTRHIEEIPLDIQQIQEPNERIIKTVSLYAEQLQSGDELGSKKYNVPSIMVVTPDTYNVVDIYKALVQIYKTHNEQQKSQYDVMVHKLFAKHIKPEEQQELLNRKHQSKNNRKVLNIYVGTPGRLAKLASMAAFKMNKDSKFRCMIFDGRKNKKLLNLFQVNETRKDSAQIIVLAKDRIQNADQQTLKIIIA